MREDYYKMGKSMGIKGASHGMIVAKLMKNGLHEIEANQIADAAILAAANRRRVWNLFVAVMGIVLIMAGYAFFVLTGLFKIAIVVSSVGVMVTGGGVVSLFQRSRTKKNDH